MLSAALRAASGLMECERRPGLLQLVFSCTNMLSLSLPFVSVLSFLIRSSAVHFPRSGDPWSMKVTGDEGLLVSGESL